MKNLRFTSLALASPSQKSANLFEFNPRFNLITGQDNSIGKSTLVKMLLWTIGCDPTFDANWKLVGFHAALRFTVDDEYFLVARKEDLISLKIGDRPIERFSRVTGEYAKRIAEVVGFDVLLQNRKDPPVLEVPPPAYYFVPFYIDQRLSWTKAWAGFGDLRQYAKWQSPVISYHVGYLEPEYFNIATKIVANKVEAKKYNREIDRLRNAVSVVEEIAPKIDSVSAGESVDDLLAEIGQAVSALHHQIDELLESLTQVREEQAQLSAQKSLVEIAAQELGLDYQFAAENTSGDTLQCPLCGTLHDNSLVQRSGILAEKSRAEQDLQDIVARQAKLETKARSLEAKIAEIRASRDEYAARLQPPSVSSISPIDALTRLSSTTIQRMASRALNDNGARVSDIDRNTRKLAKQQRELLTKEEKIALNDQFRTALSSFMVKLGVTGVNLSGVDSPMNHAKVFGSGGAAEGTRGALAYYLAVLKMIHQAQNEVIPPFIVDTPNQQEQTDMNYEAAVDLILNNSGESQVFVCAMNTPVIQRFKAIGKEFVLTKEDKLLDRGKFESIWPAMADAFA